MEKAQILSAIKSKIGTTDSRFDKTIEKFIEKKKLCEIADADLNLDQYTDDLKWHYEQAIGLANHEIATAKAEWEKANPKPQPQHQPQPQPQIPDEIKQLLDSQNSAIDELKSQLSGYQQKRTEDEIRNLLKKNGAELKANETLWEMAIGQTELKASAEETLDGVKSKYEALQSKVFGNSQPPYGNSTPPDPAAQTKSTLDKFFASKPGFSEGK